MTDIPAADAPPPEAAAAEDGWKPDARGRQYVRAEGRSGIIYRQGEETIAEALARDQKPKDERPRRKSKTAKKPPPPAKADLRELEVIIAEALRSPGMVCATFGDVWAADHFTNQGPVLARNLILASQHNPWLKKKLETMASGGDAAMKLISMVGVGGALFGYAVPPIIWWFNLPVPDKGREMFGIPPRREPEAPYARSSPPPAPEPAAAAAA